ncbi:MAG: squalene--hopene cyclase [Actinobacteria bacterium]|nr:squalene--hopene cyclase [Actinomycetota bacterium]
MSKIDLKKLDCCISDAQNHLLSLQQNEGYWAGILEADVSVVAGFIPLLRFLGIKDIEKEKKAYNYLLERQNNDGSWSLYWKGPGSLDVTVQSYFCLKMTGASPQKEFMQKASNFILAGGGIENTNTYTKIILALFGQYPWKYLPSIPPEIIFLPNKFFINIYDFASWTRATIMAFSIILTLQPVYEISTDENIFELYRDKKNIFCGEAARSKNILNLESIFIILDKAIKLWEKTPLKVKPGRKNALKKVENWILEHQEQDGSWGGIMLPWLFSLIALKCLGYTNDHSAIKKGLKGLDDFVMSDEKIIILQPATSPVWDTAWSLIALAKSGINGNYSALKKGANWLLKKQVKINGDWKIKNPNVNSGCWSFEFYNDFYPDIDDTAIVCYALNLIDFDDNHNKNEAVQSGINWVINMQNSDGSWAAFDKNNNKKLLRHIPYADFITPLDFGSPDITGHVLTVLGQLGYSKNFKPVKKALKYLIKNQEKNGSWYGRWGVNYIYGTCKVLQAAESLKLFNDFSSLSLNSAVRKALFWLENCQNKDGGWGESCTSYEAGEYTPLYESTASQTAWAVTGLLASDKDNPYAEKGIDFLINSQNKNGSWDENYYTGGGFPGAFYLKYGLYKDYFPLIALLKYRNKFKK